MENKQIFVVKTFEEAEKALEFVKDEMIFGIDLEWKPEFDGKYHSTAIIQIASNDICIIFCMIHLKTLPKTLKRILLHPFKEKIGCGIQTDKKRFLKDWNIVPINYIDIGEVAKDYGWYRNSLKFLAENILGIKLIKGETLSNWENLELTQSQISYAADDAWTSRSLYNDYFKSFALSCHYCSKVFLTWAQKRRHQRGHGFIYQCLYCPKLFSRLSNCQEHLKIIHPTENQ